MRPYRLMLDCPSYYQMPSFSSVMETKLRFAFQKQLTGRLEQATRTDGFGCIYCQAGSNVLFYQAYLLRRMSRIWLLKKYKINEKFSQKIFKKIDFQPAGRARPARFASQCGPTRAPARAWVAALAEATSLRFSMSQCLTSHRSTPWSRGACDRTLQMSHGHEPTTGINAEVIWSVQQDFVHLSHDRVVEHLSHLDPISINHPDMIQA